MSSGTRTCWIGTYPHGGPSGSGEGVWRAEVDAERGRFLGARLAVATPSPSFVALHPRGGTLYAVAETSPGAVTAFSTAASGRAATAGEPGAPGLVPRGPAVALGADDPCHVLCPPGAGADDAVWVTSYADGDLCVLGVDADGGLTGAVRRYPHVGSGPDAERQDGPHAHFVAAPAVPAGAGAARGPGPALVVDLGTDELRRHPLDAPDGSAPTVAARFPPGTGPRHLAVLPGGHLVVAAELDPAVLVLAPRGAGSATGESADGYDVVARYDATAASPPPGERSYPSHVAVTADGTRVVVAVRGADVLSVHAVVPAPDGGAPTLRHLADTPTGGAWPRHFALLRPGTGPDDLVVVANERDGADGAPSCLTLIALDRADGAGRVLDTLALPAPACVVEA